MYRCPYCQGTNLTPVSSNRLRPDAIELVQCDGCQGHSANHINGRTYPLHDRANPEGDPINRVVDN